MKTQIHPLIRHQSDAVAAFLADLDEIQRRHGLCISHEDAGHGAFLVLNYSRLHRDLLFGASDSIKHPIQRRADSTLVDLPTVLNSVNNLIMKTPTTTDPIENDFHWNTGAPSIFAQDPAVKAATTMMASRQNGKPLKETNSENAKHMYNIAKLKNGKRI
jgi:hypothetical protein